MKRGESMSSFNLKKVVLRDFDKRWLGELDNKPAFWFNTCVVSGVGGDYFVSQDDGRLVLYSQDGEDLAAYRASERGWSKMLALDVIACYETDNEARGQSKRTIPRRLSV